MLSTNVNVDATCAIKPSMLSTNVNVDATCAIQPSTLSTNVNVDSTCACYLGKEQAEESRPLDVRVEMKTTGRD